MENSYLITMLYFTRFFSVFFLAAHVLAAEPDDSFWDSLNDLNALDDSQEPAAKRRKLAETSDHTQTNHDQSHTQINGEGSSDITSQDPLNNSEIIKQFLMSEDDAGIAETWFFPTAATPEIADYSPQIEVDAVNQSFTEELISPPIIIPASEDQTQISSSVAVTGNNTANQKPTLNQIAETCSVNPAKQFEDRKGTPDDLLKEIMGLNLPAPCGDNDEDYENAVKFLKDQSHRGLTFTYLRGKLRFLSQRNTIDVVSIRPQIEKLITISGSLGREERLTSPNLSPHEKKIIKFLKKSELSKLTKPDKNAYLQLAAKLRETNFPKLNALSFMRKLENISKRQQPEIIEYRQIIQMLAKSLKAK